VKEAREYDKRLKLTGLFCNIAAAKEHDAAQNPVNTFSHNTSGDHHGKNRNSETRNEKESHEIPQGKAG
jgi:hypothetical protein